MVVFQLNGKEVSVPKGSTVMEAAKQEGVSIPHFCWHPGLPVAGVCRFCMVHVEGARKLEIACNLKVSPGMVVRTDLDEVKDAHKWALEFHLVNHPLDCPICDQAGECGLQDYYVSVGKYQSQMTRPKVLKPKAIDLGSELVLDTERCILCSRCVRFEEEVTKTEALGIFERGDRAIIGTHNGEKLSHNYQENLVDICPVGAFTSRRFRFKQRVWFLTEKSMVCPGCSTGCHVSVHAKPAMRRFYRVKPEQSAVNGHWMCDKGRAVVEHLNPEHRLSRFHARDALTGQLRPCGQDEVFYELFARIKRSAPERVGLLVSAHYTNEEYAAFFAFFVQKMGVKKVFQWRDSQEKIDDFDGILLRGDHNPNTRGLIQALDDVGIKKNTCNELSECLAANLEVLIVLAPEVPWSNPRFKEEAAMLPKSAFVSLWTVHHALKELDSMSQLVPLKGFAEKGGSFTNFNGVVSELKESYDPVVDGVLDLREAAQAMTVVAEAAVSEMMS